MCGTCGCGGESPVPTAGGVDVELHARVMAHNDHAAEHNRAHFRAAGLTVINLMGSPGAGKTALLEATARARPGLRLAAVSGDLATDNDADRLAKAGIRSRSITTGTVCHLDAEMLHDALHHWSPGDAEVLVVENVGNLVCPAIFDLGQAANVVCLSVTEGDDKPLKYPVMFREADLVVITKADLLPYLPGASLEGLRASLAQVMPDPRCIVTSATGDEGTGEWLGWIDALRARTREGES